MRSSLSRRAPVAVTLAVTGLVAAACGNTTAGGSGQPADGPPPTSPTTSTPVEAGPPSAKVFADAILARVQLPAGARRTAQAASKALVGLPVHPALNRTPVVRMRYWVVDSPAADVYAWLGQRDGSFGKDDGATSVGSGDVAMDPAWATPRYRTYSVPAPPAIADAQLYVGVVALDSHHAAVAAYAVTLPQPARPDAEVVPTTAVRAVIGWSLAAGGTPVRRPLSGQAAATLARDFDALRVDTRGPVPCPLIPQGAGSEITVTFTAGGHSWRAVIPVCPSIAVTGDGHPLPALAFGQPFLRDVKGYTGFLPWDGALAGGGPITPLGGVATTMSPPLSR